MEAERKEIHSLRPAGGSEAIWGDVGGKPGGQEIPKRRPQQRHQKAEAERKEIHALMPAGGSKAIWAVLCCYPGEAL